jgi:long-chain fatty acid transport protein
LTGQVTEYPYGVDERGTGSWQFPDHLVLGYSYRPTPEWNFEADADWTHWSLLKTVTLNTATGPITLPFFWTNSWYYEIGATHFWKTTTGRFSFSAGYCWSGNSIPDQFYSPSLPDMSRNIATIGCGYVWAHWSLSIALERGLRSTRAVTAGYVSNGQSPNGTYASSFNALDVTEQFSW